VEYSFNLFLPPLDRKLPRLAMRLQRALARIGRGPLRLIATDYIVAARRLAGAVSSTGSASAT
jgi:hypothetical protein